MAELRKRGMVCGVSCAVALLAAGLVVMACDSVLLPGAGAEDGSPDDMAERINSYRQDKGLEAIPISPSLTLVAQKHVQDLEKNHPDTGKCNLHSWSAEGSWTPCCYTDDHAEAECMWNKPRELTDYAGTGYEISATHSGSMTAGMALQQWKGSEPHHDVITNRGIWSDNQWRAVGGAISAHYAVVWFGESADPESQ